MNYSNLSFHTFEVHKKIKNDELKIYNKILYEYCNKNEKRMYSPNKEENNILFNDVICEDPNLTYMEKNITICEALKDKGIIIKLVECRQYNCYESMPLYSGIWLRINPRRVINCNDYIGIFDIKDTEMMLGLVYRRLMAINHRFPDIDKFILARLDLCKNVQLNDQSIVENYIKLFKRCKIPKGYKMSTFYDEKNRKYMPSKNGIKAFNDSHSLVAYNKKAQMDSQDYNFNNMSSAEGILRFEIQKLRQSIVYMGKKDGVKEIKEYLSKGNKYALSEFNKLLPKFFCTGDYIKKKDACEKVKNSDNEKKTKKHMLELLESTSIHRSLEFGINEIKRLGYSDVQVEYALKCFNQINVNPVTLPRDWGQEVLPNPIKLVSLL